MYVRFKNYFLLSYFKITIFKILFFSSILTGYGCSPVVFNATGLATINAFDSEKGVGLSISDTFIKAQITETFYQEDESTDLESEASFDLDSDKETTSDDEESLSIEEDEELFEELFKLCYKDDLT